MCGVSVPYRNLYRKIPTTTAPATKIGIDMLLAAR
jgi:hypothetical protein